jgi:hypothetical protein
VEEYLKGNAWLLDMSDRQLAEHLAEVGLDVSREYVRRLRPTIAPPKPKPDAITAPLPFEESPHDGNR